MASVRYLQHGEYRLERIEEDGQRDAATITMFRLRPVRPGRAPALTHAPAHPSVDSPSTK
jgi:hypothetical protein